ncbi:hypothetical protein PR003_g30147 [Phytophthora rubi]|uniref:Uncharacterized protein n=1 Tax=Phytophthora rubi TaxID=129364 RepID=A0A6A4BC95_9STRA|nr:hypothetical protein PR003_g30147 [Phytophthora rubi]
MGRAHYIALLSRQHSRTVSASKDKSEKTGRRRWRYANGMIGTDTGGSSCVSQEHNRTCTATEKMQRATTADTGPRGDRELGHLGDDLGHEHFDGNNSGKCGHPSAAGSVTAERD